jgi:hypothetical protein
MRSIEGVNQSMGANGIPVTAIIHHHAHVKSSPHDELKQSIKEELQRAMN